MAEYEKAFGVIFNPIFPEDRRPIARQSAPVFIPAPEEEKATAMIINQGNLANLFTAFSSAFKTAFDSAPTYADKLGMRVSSASRQETYAWLGQFPSLVEWLGDRNVKGLAAQSYTILNRKFESTVTVARDDISDDQFGVFSPLFAEMGRAAKQHPDTLLAALIAAGFAALCYDGQTFFNANHPVKDANGANAVASNIQAGGLTPWYLLDTSRGIRPFVFQVREPYEFQALTQPDAPRVFMRDEYLYGVRARVNAGYGLWQLAFGSQIALTAANYKAARAAMTSLRGDMGQLLGVTPTTLVVAASMEEDARLLVKAQTLAAGASNPWVDSAEMIVVPYL
jgi:phage major head subunit gpT-like protein